MRIQMLLDVTANVTARGYVQQKLNKIQDRINHINT